MSNFVDPIDEILARHNGESNKVTEEQPAVVEETADVENTSEPESEYDPLFDINYGDTDLDEEIKAEEDAEHQQRQAEFDAMMQSKEENAPDEAPPISLDPQVQKEGIDFQANNVAIVTTMVNKVVAKHHLIAGGIPDEKRRQVMGELIFLYQKDGDVITPEFEQLILSNWEGNEVAEQPQDNSNAEETEVEEKREAPVVNINVPTNTPVTVNIDDSIMMEQSTEKVVNIVVHEVSETELRSANIIENTMMEGIITPYNTGKTDIPMTLPLSVYRADIRGLTMFEMIQLNAIGNGNEDDAELKLWSMLYKLTRNASIGEFKTFDDFLKATAYADMNAILWGAYVATADDEVTIIVNCGNQKCRAEIPVKFAPRSIIHVDEENIPDYYEKTHMVAPGKAALEHWQEIHGRHKLYELPDSKILVELSNLSAYERLNEKQKALDELWLMYNPEDYNHEKQIDPSVQDEYNFSAGCIIAIKSMTINKNGKSYRFTNWKDILNIIKISISNTDFIRLSDIINKRGNIQSPLKFTIDIPDCPKCGFHHQPLNAERAMRALFFQLQNQSANTTTNFIEMPKN